MAEFPQVHWKTIGRDNVPFSKPQHYKKGSETDTELTGHDNPFPVANYTMNDSGIWLPVSKDDPMPTQLTGSNVEEVLSFDKNPEVELSPGSEFDILEQDLYSVEKFKGSVRFYETTSEGGVDVIVRYYIDGIFMGGESIDLNRFSTRNFGFSSETVYSDTIKISVVNKKDEPINLYAYMVLGG